jgi:hypothetical protein
MTDEPKETYASFLQWSEAMRRQAAQREKSLAVDRTGWTRQQWIDDARALMEDIDGASTSLVNGHVMALLEEAQELGEMKARLRAAWPGPEYMEHKAHPGKPDDPGWGSW